MSDPFVPTGRELDEGVTGPGLSPQDEPKEGLLRRLWRRTARHSGRNLTDIHLEVDPHVAARPSGIRPRQVEPAGSDSRGNGTPSHLETSAAPSPEVSPKAANDSDLSSSPLRDQVVRDQQHPSPSQTKPSAAPSSSVSRTAAKPKSDFVPTPAFMAAVIAVSRSPIPEAEKLARGYLKSNDDQDGYVRWWLKCRTGPLPALTDQLVQSAPPPWRALAETLHATGSNPMSLMEYQSLCLTWDSLDVAIKDLERRSRDYPSLQKVLITLKHEDLEIASEARNFVDYDSAAWKACSHEIERAVRALEEARLARPRPDMVKLPRMDGGSSPLLRSVISTLCTPSSTQALRSAALNAIDTFDMPHAVRSITKTIVRHGQQHS